MALKPVHSPADKVWSQMEPVGGLISFHAKYYQYCGCLAQSGKIRVPTDWRITAPPNGSDQCIAYSAVFGRQPGVRVSSYGDKLQICAAPRAGSKGRALRNRPIAGMGP